MTIEQRVAKLERQNQWMKRGGGLALAAVACVVLMGQGNAEELPNLEVRSLVVKDAAGHARIFLGTNHKSYPSLIMRDVDGRRVVDLNVHHGGSNLQIRSRTNKSSLALVSNKFGTAVIAYDKVGNARARMGIGGDGNPRLAAFDMAGKPIWQAPPK